MALPSVPLAQGRGPRAVATRFAMVIRGLSYDALYQRQSASKNRLQADKFHMQTTTGRKLAEPLILFAAGAFLLQVSRQHGAAAINPSGTEAVARHAAVAHQLLFFYGALLLILALGSYLLSRDGNSLKTTLLHQLRPGNGGLPEQAGTTRATGGSGRWWLGIAVLIAIGLRACFADQPMRYDESFTFLYFVKNGYGDLFYYPLPNNHILYTLLEKLSVLAMGSSPVGIRLPALLAGVALIPLTYRLCRKLDGRSSGVFAAGGVAIMPFLVLYSTNGRGYSLLALLAVAIPCVMVEDEGRINGRRWLLPALLSALGMLVMPSMLYAIAGIFVWSACVLLIQTRNWKPALGFLGPYAATTAILTLLFYTPVAIRSDGWDSLTSNRFVQPLPMTAFESGIGPHLIGALQDFSRDIPALVTILVITLCALGLQAAFRSRNHALLLLLPGLLFGAGVLFVAKRSIPFSRTWIYLIPFFLVVADAGFSLCCSKLAPPIRNMTVGAIAALAALFAFGIAAKNVVAAYPDTGRATGAREVARFLGPRLSKDDAVCAKLPADSIMAYYLWRGVIPQELPPRTDADRLFLIRPEVEIQGVDEGIRGATRLFKSSETALYQWTALDQEPEFIRQYTCWSPAAGP